jgi:ribosomal protein S18 acetylase RimI-like enzyme
VQVQVTTWYLEMLAPGQMGPAARPVRATRLESVSSPPLSRWLYAAVGKSWHWVDRLGWDDARWIAWVERADVTTLVLHVGDEIAGFIELEQQAGDNVEVAYFGLLPRFFGQGLGGYLLSEGVRHAWSLGARRVWVHTCTLDGPRALANYQARGFRVYKTETSTEELSSWTSAR